MKIYIYKDLLVQVPADTSHVMMGNDGVLRAYFVDPLTGDQQEQEGKKGTSVRVLNWEKSNVRAAYLQEYAPVILYESAPPNTERYAPGDRYSVRSSVSESQLVNSEVHAVVSCYSPARKPWCQVLKLKVEGLSIDNTLSATVQEVLHTMSA